MSPTKTGGNIAVRARGSTGCTTSSSSSRLPEVRFELERKRLAELSVRVRCIFRFAEVILLRWRTEAWIHISMQFHFSCPDLIEKLTARGL